MKRTAAALAACLALSLFGCAAREEYDLNPDLSQKVIGSSNRSEMADRIPWEDTEEQLVRYTEVAVVGEVIADDTESTFNMYGTGPEAEEAARQTREEWGVNAYGPCTIATVRVEQVLWGDIGDETEIRLFQLGSPHVSDTQTKVEKGERVLLLLLLREDGLYKAPYLEDSVFYLDGDDKITSMGDKKICARYDGRSLDLLARDVTRALNARTDDSHRVAN
jgi:hypothetical protein